MQHGTGRVGLEDPVLYKEKKVETTTGGQSEQAEERRKERSERNIAASRTTPKYIISRNVPEEVVDMATRRQDGQR